MSELMITIAHVRKALLCAQGARRWCERYNLSWKDLTGAGLPASVILATGDAFGAQVVQVAQEEANGVGRGQ